MKTYIKKISIRFPSKKGQNDSFVRYVSFINPIEKNEWVIICPFQRRCKWFKVNCNYFSLLSLSSEVQNPFNKE